MILEKKPNSKDKGLKYVLLALMFIIGVILFKQLKPYFSGFLGAFTLYVLLKGQMVYLLEKKKLNKALSSALIVLEALLFFLIPLTGFALLTIDTISGLTIDTESIIHQATILAKNIESKIGFDIFTPENLLALPKMGSSLVQSLGASVYSLIINTVVIVFVLYYLLYNYSSLGHIIKEILPFKEENKQIIAEETKQIIQANAIGIPVLAIIQGSFAYIGYLILGINNPLLYGILTAFATIIPLVGTSIVWLSLSIVELMAGNYTTAIFLLLYGFIIIGGVDNIARFILQKKLADIHPLITVFGVLVGIPMFGFWGVIFGPLIISLFILFFNMYRYDYIIGSKANPRMTSSRLRNKKENIGGYPKNKKEEKRKEEEEEDS